MTFHPRSPEARLLAVLDLLGISAEEIGRKQTRAALGAVISDLVVRDGRRNEDVQYFRNRVRAAANVVACMTDAKFDALFV